MFITFALIFMEYFAMYDDMKLCFPAAFGKSRSSLVLSLERYKNNYNRIKHLGGSVLQKEGVVGY